MALPNIFQENVVRDITNRIDKLSTATNPSWGKMNVAEMLAHCNVTYELALEDKHPKASGLQKFLMKLFVKKIVVSEKPYAKNSQTAPVFKVPKEQDFQLQKSRMISYLGNVAQLGPTHFEGKESHSFGKLSSQEWNNMFYKHLDHHLNQFGV
jgi:Protein of unknown function (DUF1569)